jgi:hypothetical protein
VAGYFPGGVAVYDEATRDLVVEMEMEGGGIDVPSALTTYTGPSGERVVATGSKGDVQVGGEVPS